MKDSVGKIGGKAKDGAKVTIKDGIKDDIGKNNHFKSKDTGMYSFKYFILRTNTLIMYREVYKSCSHLPPEIKLQTRQYLRNEFESDALGSYSEESAKYKLGLARKKINQFKQQLLMLG